MPNLSDVFACAACRFGVCSNGDHKRVNDSILDGTYGSASIPAPTQEGN